MSEGALVVVVIGFQHDLLIERSDHGVHLLSVHSGGEAFEIRESPVGSEIGIIRLVQLKAGNALPLELGMMLRKDLSRLFGREIRHQTVPDIAVS